MNESPIISGLVPMIQVADVERSATFYRLLGFEIGHQVPKTGEANWAWLYSPGHENWKRAPNLMLARAEEELKPDAQQVVFYHYAARLVDLREQLLAAGLKPGEITYPDYLPEGELRMLDPDGYCVMLAQVTEHTP